LKTVGNEERLVKTRHEVIERKTKMMKKKEEGIRTYVRGKGIERKKRYISDV